MRGLAEVSTDITVCCTVCNAVPSTVSLSANFTDVASNMISASSIAFRQCGTARGVKVTADTTTQLSYKVVDEADKVLTSSTVIVGSIADQNVVIIKPTGSTAGSDVFSPVVYSPISAQNPAGDDSYLITLASYCVGLTTELTTNDQSGSTEIPYGMQLPFSSSGFQGGGSLTLTPSQGSPKTASASPNTNHGKAGFLACTGMKDNTGDFKPEISIFGVPPSAAAGLAATVSGWVTLAVAAVIASKRL